MKKLIITAAIALTATFSIASYQTKALTNIANVVKKSASNSSDESFGPISTNRLDISQVD